MSNTNVGKVLLGLTILLGGCDSGHHSPIDANEPPAVEQPGSSLDQKDPGSNADEPVEQGNTPSETQLTVVDRFPQSSDTNIALITHISLTFNEPLLNQGSNDELLQVFAHDQAIQGDQQQLGERTLQFIPHKALEPNATYRVTITSPVMSQSGDLLHPQEWGFTTVGDVHTTPQDVIDLCMSEQDVEMLAAVNTARAESRNCGDSFRVAVDKLSWSCQLQEAAIKHSEDMSGHNFFSHTGTDGAAVDSRVTGTGYRWNYVGENIAGGQRSVEQVMTGWLASPGHCLNIMSPNYTEFGFGYSVDPNSDYQRYWTQVFARPRIRQ